MARPKGVIRQDCSIGTSANCLKARVGANGWAGSRRRSSPRANPSHARRWLNSSDRVANSTILSATLSTNFARALRPRLRRRRLSAAHQTAFFGRDPRGERWRATRREPSRTDADRTFGGDGDCLSATRHPCRDLAARRQGNQPRRHRRPETSRSHRRALRAPEPRRALRLCHDKNSFQFLGWRRYATFPTSNGSKTKACCSGRSRTTTSTTLGARRSRW